MTTCGQALLQSPARCRSSCSSIADSCNHPPDHNVVAESCNQISTAVRAMPLLSPVMGSVLQSTGK